MSNDRKDRDIYNVVGAFEGAVEPGEHILPCCLDFSSYTDRLFSSLKILMTKICLRRKIVFNILIA